MMQWYNEPPRWTDENGRLTVTTGPKTDFWRKTHYGFIRDNGHFYFQPITGDFVAEVRFSGQYGALYDQAGLMARLNECTWLKCGIEFVGGAQYLSVVVTRDLSDWSVVPLPHNPPTLWLRLVRRLEAVEVHYSTDGAAYQMARLAHFTLSETVQVGPMCASPEGDGFTVTFEGFSVRANAGEPSHAL